MRRGAKGTYFTYIELKRCEPMFVSVLRQEHSNANTVYSIRYDIEEGFSEALL